MAYFDPQTISQEPLVYFRRSGNPAARIGLTMTFYFGAPGLPERRQALVHCIQHYLQQARGQLRRYAVQGDRRHRVVRADESPDPVLLEAMTNPERVLDFEAGVELSVAHSWSIAALAESVVRANYLGYLLFTYPLEELNRLGLDGFIRQFVAICDDLQVEHAYAGLGLVLPFNVGGQRSAHQVIGEVLMQYPGLDAYDLNGVAIHGENGIKSVNFLTAVSHRLLEKAGGAETVAAQAGRDIKTYSYSNGVVFQAGEVLQLGALNQPPPDYVALGRALKMVRAPYPDTMFYDPAGRDNKAFTQCWLGRFDGTHK